MDRNNPAIDDRQLDTAPCYVGLSIVSYLGETRNARPTEFINTAHISALRPPGKTKQVETMIYPLCSLWFVRMLIAWPCKLYINNYFNNYILNKKLLIFYI